MREFVKIARKYIYKLGNIFLEIRPTNTDTSMLLQWSEEDVLCVTLCDVCCVLFMIISLKFRLLNL